VYADVPTAQASGASSIASTAQQLSMSFGVAAAGITTVIFIPDRLHAVPGELMSGLHQAFLALGAFTILSTLVFSRLRRNDGVDETEQHDIHLG